MTSRLLIPKISLGTIAKNPLNREPNSKESSSDTASKPINYPNTGSTIESNHNNYEDDSDSSSETTQTPKIQSIFLSSSSCRQVAPKLMTKIPEGSLLAKITDSNTIKL